MNHDMYDPLAPFRRSQQAPQGNNPARQLSAEHQALRLAIDALNEVPNSRIRMEGYTTTYKLIPDLEKAYREGTERTKLEQLAPRMYRTLLLCEDVLSEVGRLDDGTPSIQTLTIQGIIDIRTIREAADNLSEEQVMQLMQGTQEYRQPMTDANERGAKDEKLREAAPELYEALIEASRALTLLDPLAENHDAKIIDDALAKARSGQQPTPEQQKPVTNEQLKASNTELVEALITCANLLGDYEGKMDMEEGQAYDKALAAIANARAVQQPEQQPAREISAPEPERNIDLEPDL